MIASIPEFSLLLNATYVNSDYIYIYFSKQSSCFANPPETPKAVKLCSIKQLTYPNAPHIEAFFFISDSL
jgi:hypothetical protein